MKQYLKAEFDLCKKNRGNFILSIFLLFVYCLLLLFSGVAGMKYAAFISMLGFIIVILFVIPWYFSPAAFFQNRKKVCITMEQMVLMLGESKRTFVKIRILLCVLHCLAMMGMIAVMQIPAYLIAGEQYSLLVFETEVLAVLGFSLLAMSILFLCSGRRLIIGLPFWSGLCGGIAGSILGDVQEFTNADDVLNLYIGVAIIGCIVFVFSVLYRYFKTVCEERRGLPKKQIAGEE